MDAELAEPVAKRARTDARGLAKYEKGAEIGKGEYGVVFRALRRATGEDVAIKRVRARERTEGANFTALREIKFLRAAAMRHENLLGLSDVFVDAGELCLVVELCATDLQHVIHDRRTILRQEHVKGCARAAPRPRPRPGSSRALALAAERADRPPYAPRYTSQMFRAVAHCHAHWVLHRDLKPANLFVRGDGVLKLGDFGAAREHDGERGREFTPGKNVCTLWYRAPELLFNTRAYGAAVDVWSCGAIVAEMLLREARGDPRPRGAPPRLAPS
jgi:cyclin-dependent kinase 7